MKISISLPEEAVAVLDQYAERSGLPTRSAAVQHAIGLLRHPHLEEDYAAAWGDWAASGEHAVWEAAASDGLDDAAR